MKSNSFVYDVKRIRTKRLYLCTKFRTTYKNDNKCVALHNCTRLYTFLKFGRIQNERRTVCIIICLNMVSDRRLRLNVFYGICLYVKSAMNQSSFSGLFNTTNVSIHIIRRLQ